MWGFLRLELEALKTCRDDPTLDKQLQRCSSSPTAESNEDGIEMEDMSSTNEPRILKALDQASIERKSDMSEKSDLQILLELCLYATAFAAFGMVAAAHRETMWYDSIVNRNGGIREIDSIPTLLGTAFPSHRVW